jgi:DNA polymerase V
MTNKLKHPVQVVGIARPQEAAANPMPVASTNVRAGFPSPADDYIEKQLDLNELMIKHPAATFFVRVEGESMTDAGIHPGDTLVVDRSLEASSGKIIIAAVNGEFTVKRLARRSGKLWLCAENSRFSDIPVEPDSDFQIWGVVTYVVHKCMP